MKRLLLIAALALFVTACGFGGVSGTSVVSVWHDDARGVTCWTVSEGISCLPDKAFQP